MGNKHIDTNFLDRAMIFAINAHKGVERRGKGFPYVVHPMEVVSIVATMTNDQELLAAAALHDVVEDTEYTLDDLRNEFGDRVAELVKSESDVFMKGLTEEDSWIVRKQAGFYRIKHSSIDAKMVALGDKLSNMRAIYRDYLKVGDDIWNIFHVQDKKLHAWHYHGLVDSLRDLSNTIAFAEFEWMVDKVFGKKEEGK